MTRVALFATKSAPIDVDVLHNVLGAGAKLELAPERCLRKPLDGESEQSLCSFVADADAIFFRVGQVTRSIIYAARSLKVVAVHGVGTDSVDVRAATERDVFVTITPQANSNAVEST